jgi:hypothetical protein
VRGGCDWMSVKYSFKSRSEEKELQQKQKNGAEESELRLLWN